MGTGSEGGYDDLKLIDLEQCSYFIFDSVKFFIGVRRALVLVT